jgi:hypothetical protein
VVGEDHLAEAVSAQQSLNVLVLVGAPTVGGLLAGVFGTGVPVALDAATFVVVTVAVALVRTRRVPGPARGSSALARSGFAVLRADRVLAPLLADVGNGYAGAGLSTLLMARTPDGARGRVSAAAGALFGGGQGASLLLGGAVALVLPPRAIYAVGDVLGLSGAVLLAGHAPHRGRAEPAVDVLG